MSRVSRQILIFVDDWRPGLCVARVREAMLLTRDEVKLLLSSTSSRSCVELAVVMVVVEMVVVVVGGLLVHIIGGGCGSFGVLRRRARRFRPKGVRVADCP